MKGKFWFLKLTLFILIIFNLNSFCDEKKIVKITLIGADRISQEAFLSLTSLRPGQSYDEDYVKREFKRIWDSGLFEDLSVEKLDIEGGIEIVFKVKEKPIVASVEYRGSKKLTSTTVIDKLKENKAEVKTGVALNFDSIKKAESALRFIAAEKGYPDATVTSEIKNLGKSQVAVVFNVEEGPKTRIKEIKFSGVNSFSKRKLAKTMKKIREHWFLSWLTRHDIYSESRYSEDERLLRELYESEGFIDVEIGDPIIESEIESKGRKKYLKITIPINEGISYKLGEVRIEGNKVISDEELLKGIKFEKNKTFNKVAFDQVLKVFEKKYGEKGYIYATAMPIYKKDKENKVVDIVVEIKEDEQYYVNRIEFYGNTSTRDFVLRREMQVYEQELFNYKKYERGLYKLKMTGLFDIKEDPKIIKVEQENKVNIEITGTEANKNELLFGGGYGGVNGFFLTGQFRTYNFLGRGTTLSFNADFGKVQKLYSINYSDPWFFGKRIGFTTSVFNQKLKYIQFDQLSKGGQFAVTFPLGDFLGYQVGYRYERAKLKNVESYLKPNINYYGWYTRDTTTSTFFTTLFWNSVNHPFRPTRGWSSYLTLNVAGGPFGGDNYFLKPIYEGSLYLPTFKRQNTAFRLQVGWITPFDGREIPLWERFFLGGEDSLRGFGVRSVFPLTKDNRYFVDPQSGTIEGGNRYYLLNLEYVFHVTEQMDIALFTDIGNTYHERQKWELSNYRANAGVEIRFFLPTFNIPLRLIWGTNLNKKPYDDFSHFQFTIGLTF